MYSSPILLPAGDMPARPPGEFQFVTVAGEVAGDSSLFIDLFAETCASVPGGGGGTIDSIPGSGFLRWPRCLRSILSKPSFVNGLGRTSFIPGIRSALPFLDTTSQITVLEVHGDIITSNVRRHRNYRRLVELADQVASGHSV